MAQGTIDSAAKARTLPEFSIGQARHIVKDLFVANPWVYWTDFLVSMGVGVFCYVAFRRGRVVDYLCASLELDWPGYRWGMFCLLFVISVLAFYRAVLFTHELVHIRDDQLPGFRLGWNLLCGIPFLMPSFLYETHVHHHIRKHYGTDEDGEYLPLATSPARLIVWYLGQSFVLPIVAFVRFAVLQPLTWMNRAWRDMIHQRASAMICDPGYVRPLPTDKERRVWRLQEAGSFVMAWTLVGILFAGLLPWTWILHVYALSVSIIMLNAVRTIGAHRYRCTGDHDVTFVEQLLDSVNYPQRPLLTGLWAPVGLRFHALHHLFPSMPYHNLARAHRRLMEELPADSPYRQTVSPSLTSTLAQLWREARAVSRRTARMRRAAVA
jgi:fatty acid desaturase